MICIEVIDRFFDMQGACCTVTKIGPGYSTFVTNRLLTLLLQIFTSNGFFSVSFNGKSGQGFYEVLYRCNPHSFPELIKKRILKKK